MHKSAISFSTAVLFLGAALCPAVWAQGPAQPGAINYVEGQTSLANQPLSSKSVGSVDLQQGQVLTTQNGRIEILLIPGVFLRVDHNSSVKMVSPTLSDTEAQIENGRATLEVVDLHKLNNLRIDEDGVTTQIMDTGFYDFDAARGQVLVLSGKAEIFEPGHEVRVTDGHEAAPISNPNVKPQGFDKTAYESDDFYRWSELRSQYLAEANIDWGPTYVSYGVGFADGWYWDPWFGCYTFIPSFGYLYSPFGWGFYSPFFLYVAPFVYPVHRPHVFGPVISRWGPGPHYGLAPPLRPGLQPYRGGRVYGVPPHMGHPQVFPGMTGGHHGFPAGAGRSPGAGGGGRH